MIQSLTETIGTGAGVVSTFDAFRKKRNITGYGRIGLLSDAEAMRALAVALRDGLG